MALFQCFYFSNGIVAYWENRECSADGSLRELFRQQLLREEWHTAEAWRCDSLICRVERLPNGLVDCSPDCPIGQNCNGVIPQ